MTIRGLFVYHCLRPLEKLPSRNSHVATESSILEKCAVGSSAFLKVLLNFTIIKEPNNFCTCLEVFLGTLRCATVLYEEPISSVSAGGGRCQELPRRRACGHHRIWTDGSGTKPVHISMYLTLLTKTSQMSSLSEASGVISCINTQRAAMVTDRGPSLPYVLPVKYDVNL